MAMGLRAMMLAVALLLSLPALAEELSGKVVAIVDAPFRGLPLDCPPSHW
jgi:hypothetical protein